MIFEPDFTPGTVILKTHSWDGKPLKSPLRYVVADPVRTRNGKLRVINQNGNISTNWWRVDWVPKGYVVQGDEDTHE